MKAQGKEAKTYRLSLVVCLHNEGLSQMKIAEVSGLSQGRVSQILKLSKEKGGSPLVTKSPPGRRAGLGGEQLNCLKEILGAEAKAAGFSTDGWTLRRVRAVVEQRFGRLYSLEHVRRILKKIGFTRQQPQQRDYRRDERAVERWRSETLPALKKSRRRGS